MNYVVINYLQIYLKRDKCVPQMLITTKIFNTKHLRDSYLS